MLGMRRYKYTTYITFIYFVKKEQRLWRLCGMFSVSEMSPMTIINVSQGAARYTHRGPSQCTAEANIDRFKHERALSFDCD